MGADNQAESVIAWLDHRNEIVALLRDFYDNDADIESFLRSPHELLDGVSPVDAIKNGHINIVRNVIKREIGLLDEPS
jgi:uncharacterized protein (DUF2384 family)